ncbi:hypothetical protein F4809DRAFT_289378 [Biscogniauxia mediterranea]|nr:hypothetical protein F4809DRAFT_289378 [Biscogniauxia mediterranea]
MELGSFVGTDIMRVIARYVKQGSHGRLSWSIPVRSVNPWFLSLPSLSHTLFLLLFSSFSLPGFSLLLLSFSVVSSGSDCGYNYTLQAIFHALAPKRAPFGYATDGSAQLSTHLHLSGRVGTRANCLFPMRRWLLIGRILWWWLVEIFCCSRLFRSRMSYVCCMSLIRRDTCFSRKYGPRNIRIPVYASLLCT